MGRFYSTFILAIVIFAALKLEGAETNDSCTVYLKNGQNIVMKFHEVQSFCFINDNGEGVSYNVIDSLITLDSETAQAIFQSCPGISLDLKENAYVLIFLNCIPIRPKETSLFPFQPSNISLLVRSDPSTRVGFIYDAELFGSKHFIHRFQGAIGFTNKENIFSSLGFAFGLGYRVSKDNFDFSITSNYGLFRDSPPLIPAPSDIWHGYYTPQNNPNAPAISGSVFFISPVVSYRIGEGSPFFITSGVDIFIYHERKELPRDEVSFFVGIGTDL